ncbi:BrnT family toxin [Candidatus Magnetominusculus xianensis]|uniref:Uncharacterized protein n=1 Tax=Candidatus Magnetominusculus xianensis TaxID=1748249 RepID=A0ABR5SJL5_9BACT|nr:BrnT family toxin [Candidatus Magnetominusculus xianensis]KWT94644.1 hypothetical protein ASN18_0183 [Candidatus Magnetominusculus xianensis]
MLFDWSDEKNNENVKKHNVSFEDAREVFEDAFHKSLLDRRFDYFEERWITLGVTKTGELLVVAHLYSVTSEGNEKIRIISAQPMKGGLMRKTEDNFEIKDEYDFSKGIRGRFYKPKKIPTTIRLDNDIVMFFKKLATQQKVAYQSMVNEVLRSYVTSHTDHK